MELLSLFWWHLSSCCLLSWVMINEHPWQMVLHASLLISRGWGISRKVWHSPGCLPVLLLPSAAICSREYIKLCLLKKTTREEDWTLPSSASENWELRHWAQLQRKDLKGTRFHFSSQFLDENTGVEGSQQNSVPQVHLRTCYKYSSLVCEKKSLSISAILNYVLSRPWSEVFDRKAHELAELNFCNCNSLME